MKLESQSFQEGQPIPPAFAFGRPDPTTHVTFSENRSPHLAWSQAPEGTRSFALLCIDGDVPTVGDDVNQEGKVVPADLPRTDFVHWLMANIPADVRELAAGCASSQVTPGGKSDPAGPAGSCQGVNDYTGWFAGDETMGGTYLGYDGPGPPWNDARIHHYRFELLALDVERVSLESGFEVADLRGATEGHVLARATLTGTYTLNPDLG